MRNEHLETCCLDRVVVINTKEYRLLSVGQVIETGDIVNLVEHKLGDGWIDANGAAAPGIAYDSAMAKWADIARPI